MKHVFKPDKLVEGTTGYGGYFPGLFVVRDNQNELAIQLRETLLNSPKAKILPPNQYVFLTRYVDDKWENFWALKSNVKTLI
jgi:hypothetical protein